MNGGGQDGKKHTGIILKTATALLAVLLAFAAVFAALSGSSAQPVSSRELAVRTATPAPATPTPTPEPTAVPADGLTDELTDEQALELGSDLDDTGLSLMPQGFAFSPVEGEEQTVENTDFLVPGVRDARVIEIKTRLMDLSYMEPDEPTDYYGDQAAYAVQLFQRSHDLETTGAANEETLKLLFSEDAEKYVVSVGINGTDVSELQQRLAELGYLKVKITGYFGSDTKKAVMAFQKNNGLEADGAVGELTRETLYSRNAKKAKSTATKKPTPKATATGSKSTPTAAVGSPGGSTPTAAAPTDAGQSSLPAPDSGAVETFIAYAGTLMGKPYVLGGKGPEKFDCSGFIYYALNQSGVKKLQYMTSGGWANSSFPTVEKSELQRGDILCFKGHVGIYLGNGQMLDASSDEGKIRITSNIWSKNYWNKNFRFGKRALY